MKRENRFSKTAQGATPSLLARRFAEMDERESHRGRIAQLQNELGSAGDALELCARAAEGAWDARPMAAASKDLEFGYKLCAAQMALVFRAMRKGAPPSAEDFEAVRVAVAEEVGI